MAVPFFFVKEEDSYENLRFTTVLGISE